MQTKQINLKYLDTIHFRKLLLCIFWLTGLLSGIILSRQCTCTYNTLMRSALFERSSIVSLFSVMTFPLLLSALLIWIHKPAFILPIAFVKALIFSFSASALYMGFVGAGWLMYAFVFFSESVNVTVLLWFWLRSLEGKSGFAFCDFAVSVFLLVLACVIDYCVIYPLFITVLN